MNLTERQVQVLRAFARNDMRVHATAVSTGLHPNTITYNLDRVQKSTGLDPRKFYDLVKLLVQLGPER